MYERRSVRVFDSTPIPENVIHTCLDLAMLAPNSSNLQPWEFYWVRDEKKKELLSTFCMSQPAAKTAKELLVFVARTRTWKFHSKLMLDILQKSEQPSPAAVYYYEKMIPKIYSQGLFGLYGLLKFFLIGRKY